MDLRHFEGAPHALWRGHVDLDGVQQRGCDDGMLALNVPQQHPINLLDPWKKKFRKQSFQPEGRGAGARHLREPLGALRLRKRTEGEGKEQWVEGQTEPTRRHLRRPSDEKPFTTTASSSAPSKARVGATGCDFIFT